MVSKQEHQRVIDELCAAFDEIVWMSIRYAHGRHTYAPDMVRNAIKKRASIAPFTIRPDSTLEPRPDPKDRTCCDLDSDYLFDIFEKYPPEED